MSLPPLLRKRRRVASGSFIPDVVYSSVSAEAAPKDADDALTMPSDTRAALDLLRGEFSRHSMSCGPVMLQTQVLALVKDHTAADREIVRRLAALLSPLGIVAIAHVHNLRVRCALRVAVVWARRASLAGRAPQAKRAACVRLALEPG